MCAINGFTYSDANLIKKMNDVTLHRGPDGSGIFLDEKISLGHNRLSIIDPTPSASQPMESNDGNSIVILNGEIYNFKELKKELEDEYSFKTSSDTEVILAAWQKWGEDCVKRFNGIFSLAIWDKKKDALYLARDPVGVKPLYYSEHKGKLIFSSEIKAILEHDVPRKFNTEAIGHYFRLLYVPAPHTLFEGVFKFPPAHFAIYKSGELSFTKYWEESEKLVNASKEELLKKTKSKIDEAVKRQLVSDKPLGIYLSGGVDSSIMLDSMSSVHENIDTFSVGFELTEDEQVDKFNADFLLARKTAKHYGTRHHEVLISPDEVVELLKESIWHNDEPIANPTALARLKLSKVAKEHVDVVLAGDGGDELFGGYERYRLSHAADVWQRYVPAFIREIFPKSSRLAKLNTPGGVSRYGLFMFQKDSVLSEVLNDEYISGETVEHFRDNYFSDSSFGSFTRDFLLADRKSWLVDESLTLSDKMSMANSVELRVPFLDTSVVEFSDTVSEVYKVGLFNTKILLKEAYRSYLPTHLFNQPKRGWFSPGAKWLRHDDFYQFAKEVLREDYCNETRSLFKWGGVENMLEEHYSHKRYNLSILWVLIVFQMWAKRFSVTK